MNLEAMLSYFLEEVDDYLKKSPAVKSYRIITGKSLTKRGWHKTVITISILFEASHYIMNELVDDYNFYIPIVQSLKDTKLKDNYEIKFKPYCSKK